MDFPLTELCIHNDLHSFFPNQKKRVQTVSIKIMKGLNTKPQDKWLKEVPNLANSLLGVFRQRLDGHHYREVVVQTLLTRSHLSTPLLFMSL